MGNQIQEAQALVSDPGLHNRLLNEERKWTQIPSIELKDNEIPLKILSFNIPLSGSNNWQEDWDYRQNPIAEMPRHYDVDIICYQEPHEPQSKFISSQLPEYDYYGRGRNADGTSEYQPIFWKKSRFELRDKGCFWLSTEPDVPGSQSWDSACVRQTIWVNLFDKLSRRELIIMNTHWDHVGVQARIFSAEVINDKLVELNQKYPESTIILCGDFNEEADAAGVNLLEMRPIPTPETSHFGGSFTFVGWTNEVQAIIDMIFIRGERIGCKQYGVLQDTIGTRKLTSRWKQSEDSLEAFKSVLNLSITSKSCKNYLNDKLLIDISYRYVRDRSLFVKQKLMNFIRHDDFDKYKSMADLLVERFSKLESVRMLNSPLIYVIRHASYEFLNSYLDYFFEHGLHVGCLRKFRAENPRPAIYPDFNPAKFMKAMKMVSMNGWEEKQLALAKRLLVYFGEENTEHAKQISQIRKLETTPMSNYLSWLNQGIAPWHGVDLFHAILQTMLKEQDDATQHTDIAVKVTKELLQLPIKQQPWFFGNLSRQDMKSINFPSKNFFLVTFTGSRLYYHQSSWQRRLYNEDTKKRLPCYGLLNKQAVRDLNLYQFYQLLADNNLEGMKQMQQIHNFNWREISQHVGRINDKQLIIGNQTYSLDYITTHKSNIREESWGRVLIFGNQPHPLLEYLNIKDCIHQDVVDWLFELCSLDGIHFEWEQNNVPESQLQIIQRIIEAGGKISTNLWIQYITKVMPTNITTMTSIANALYDIESKKARIFVFEQLRKIYKEQKIISDTKLTVLLAWKHAKEESIGFQNLPKELIQTIVDFIDEPPLVKVFAKILVDQYKKNNLKIAFRVKSDYLKNNLWAWELFSTESNNVSSSMIYQVVRIAAYACKYSVFKKDKAFILPLVVAYKCSGTKFAKFTFKYETDEDSLKKIWKLECNDTFFEKKKSLEWCTIEALKSRNKASLKVLLAPNVLNINMVPTKEQFTNAIKPKHNLTYEEAMKLINEIQSTLGQ